MNIIPNAWKNSKHYFRKKEFFCENVLVYQYFPQKVKLYVLSGDESGEWSLPRGARKDVTPKKNGGYNGCDDDFGYHVASVVNEGIDEYPLPFGRINAPYEQPRKDVADVAERCDGKCRKRYGKFVFSKQGIKHSRKPEHSECKQVVKQNDQHKINKALCGWRIKTKHHLYESKCNRGANPPFGAIENTDKDNGYHGCQGNTPALKPGGGNNFADKHKQRCKCGHERTCG